MRIIPYDPKYKKEYVDLNKAWVMDMFEMEETDLAELDNIDTYLEEGGQIFLAVDDDGTLIDRKLNVALTRARRQMIVVGRQDIMRHAPLLQQLPDDFA